MAKARRRDRLTAAFFAILFIGSSSILTVAIIIDNLQKKDQDNGATSQQAKGGKVLKGTQLSDFTPVTEVTELQKIDTVAGTGNEVKAGDTVTVDYTGAFAATGEIFESSKDSGQKATFPLDGVIKGWTEGLPGMKEGGTRRLIIPSDLAYGPNGYGSIPGNSNLVFDITLHSIKK